MTETNHTQPATQTDSLPTTLPASTPVPIPVEWDQAAAWHLAHLEILIKGARQRAEEHRQGTTGSGHAVAYGQAATEAADRLRFYVEQSKGRLPVLVQNLAFAEGAVVRTAQERSALEHPAL